MSFEVKPDVLHSASVEVHAITDTARSARIHADDYLSIPSGGRMINGACAELEKVRALLCDEYADDGGAVRPLRSGAFQLYFAAADYETVDAETRESFDGKIDNPGRTEGAYGTWDDLDPNGEQRGVESSDYSSILCAPTSSMSAYDTWRDIGAKVDEIAGFDWVSAPLSSMGLEDPIAKFHEDMDGDWSRLGLGIAALDQLQDYWTQVCYDLGATVKAVDECWEGHAANHAIGFFHDYAQAAHTHGTALNGVRTRLQGEVIGIRFALDAVLDAVEAMVDLIPQGDSVSEFFVDTLKSALAVPTKLVGRIKLVFDALFALCGLIVAAFSQLAGHDSLEFPRVDIPEILPVAGP